jgi:hypothetical protein
MRDMEDEDKVLQKVQYLLERFFEASINGSFW